MLIIINYNSFNKKAKIQNINLLNIKKYNSENIENKIY